MSELPKTSEHTLFGISFNCRIIRMIQRSTNMRLDRYDLIDASHGILSDVVHLNTYYATSDPRC